MTLNSHFLPMEKRENHEGRRFFGPAATTVPKATMPLGIALQEYCRDINIAHQQTLSASNPDAEHSIIGMPRLSF